MWVCVCVRDAGSFASLPVCMMCMKSPNIDCTHIHAGLLVGHGFEVLSKDHELKQHDGVSTHVLSSNFDMLDCFAQVTAIDLR